MNLTIARIFGNSGRSAKYVFNKRAQMLLFSNTNIQGRYKITKANVIERSKYKPSEGSIGFFGYCLLGMPVITFILGTWQVERWRWKLDLIEKLKQRTTTEPINLPIDLDELKDKEYYRVKVKGKYLYEKEFLIGPRSLIVNGQALSERGGGLISGRPNTGYYVITPFYVEDRDLTIMVNRGWIPKSARSMPRETNRIMNSIEIIGINRTTEKRPVFISSNVPSSGIWHFRDLDAMARVAETKPVYIELLAGYGTSDDPIGGQTRVTLRNEHVSYIITWYGLSIGTGWLWFRQFVQKLPTF